VKYRCARKCWQKFQRQFHYKRVLSKQTIHNLVNKLRAMGLLIDKKQKHKRRVLTEEKLDDIGARHEHAPKNH
jgi:transposase